VKDLRVMRAMSLFSVFLTILGQSFRDALPSLVKSILTVRLAGVHISMGDWALAGEYSLR
jgi:hypothetical protein